MTSVAADEVETEDAPSIAEIVLRILLVGAVVVTVVAVPNLALLLKPLIQHQRDHVSDRDIQHSIRRLKYRGMVRFNHRRRCLELTDKGRDRAKRYELGRLTFPPPPAVWDGRWRLVVFDVPEHETYLRELFRKKLQSLGMRYAQRSVWIYPFPCRDTLGELARRLEIEECVLFAEVDELFPEGPFLKRYGLTRLKA